MKVKHSDRSDSPKPNIILNSKVKLSLIIPRITQPPKSVPQQLNITQNFIYYAVSMNT